MNGPTQHIGLKDAAGNDALGIVEASPADYSLLGRLKAIATAVASLTFSTSATSKWSALGTTVISILGADVAPTLKNLSNSANKLGDAFENSDAATRFQYAQIELLCRGASAFTSGGVVKLWLLSAMDGTHYEDGGDSVTPARAPDYVFFLRAVATAQRLILPQVLLPPTLFKPLVRNEGGQAFTNTDDENTLRIRPYNEVQA